MKRIALLALALAAACSNKKPEERKLVGSAAPVTAPPAGSAGSAAGSAGAAAGSATGSATGSAGSAAPAKGTGFAPFDEAMAGTRPWIAADDKAGIVELYAYEDLSERTKGRFTVERKCGADAVKVVEAMGKQMAERLKDHEAPACKEEGGVTICVQRGLTEGDLVLELQYGKAGDGWRVIGARTVGMGVHADKDEAKYAALLKEQCK